MITQFITIFTIGLSVYGFQNKVFFGKLLFNPYIINHNKEWWRFFTHAFIHADWAHLIFNMLALYTFGIQLEKGYFVELFGIKASYYYVLLYIGGMVISSFPSFEKHKNNSYYSALGASGAVSAVVFSSILINPMLSLYFMFIPFPIPGYVFGGIYLFYSWYMDKKQLDNVGHDAHFWGAIFGVVFTAILKPSLISSFISHFI